MKDNIKNNNKKGLANKPGQHRTPSPLQILLAHPPEMPDDYIKSLFAITSNLAHNTKPSHWGYSLQQIVCTYQRMNKQYPVIDYRKQGIIQQIISITTTFAHALEAAHLPSIFKAMTQLEFSLNERSTILTTLAHCVNKYKNALHPYAITNILSSAVKMGVKLPLPDLNIFKQVIETKSAQFDTTGAGIVLIAIYHLRITLTQNSLRKLFKKVLQTPSCSEITALQTYTLYAYLQCTHSIQPSFPSLTAPFITKAHARLYKSINYSSLQDKISRHLRNYTKVTFREEVIIGPTIVDLYIPSKKLVIEVNGPCHYEYNGTKTLKTCQKEALLTSLGYSNTSISYVEWTKAHTTKKKTQLLLSKLA